MDCVFCQIAAGESPANIVFKDELVTAFLDSDPINLGHILIVPNMHFLDADDMPEATFLHLLNVARKLLIEMKRTCKIDGYSMMQNGGIFNDIGHYHLHVFPRYEGDGFGWTTGV